MLKGIDPSLSAELVHVLMLMGHGDDLVVCDVNHPAATIARETAYGRSWTCPAAASRGAGGDPLLDAVDDFVEAPVPRMEVVGDPGRG